MWLILDSLLQRYVPFAAVAAANLINIPLMRQNEIMNGIVVCDENGNELTTSKVSMPFRLLAEVVLIGITIDNKEFLYIEKQYMF